MSEDVEEITSWVLGAISKIKAEKQQPNEERITKVLFNTYGVEKDMGLEHLKRCVNEGIVVGQMAKSGKHSYMDAKKFVGKVRGKKKK